MNEKIEKIKSAARAIIVELRPTDSIGLRHCLRAIENNATIYHDLPLIMQLQNFEAMYGKVVACWGLALKDDIESQSEECVDLIANLV